MKQDEKALLGRPWLLAEWNHDKQRWEEVGVLYYFWGHIYWVGATLVENEAEAIERYLINESYPEQEHFCKNPEGFCGIIRFRLASRQNLKHWKMVGIRR